MTHRGRGAVTLVEISLVLLLASLLIGILWSILGGGMQQSSLNLGRTEALMSGLLMLDTLEEDLRNLSLREKGDLSLFAAEGPGTRILTFKSGRAAGAGGEGALIQPEEVSYRLVPAEPELNFITRNGKQMAGAKVAALRFVPKVIDRKNGGRLHFVQTFLSMSDSSGRYRLPLMGLTHVRVISADQQNPYWNPNPDQSYRGAGP